jgi:hypothetical protein
VPDDQGAKVRGLFETTLFAGLRKAGEPEEWDTIRSKTRRNVSVVFRSLRPVQNSLIADADSVVFQRRDTDITC